jgi:hypothetical protein
MVASHRKPQRAAEQGRHPNREDVSGYYVTMVGKLSWAGRYACYAQLASMGVIITAHAAHTNNLLMVH